MRNSIEIIKEKKLRFSIASVIGWFAVLQLEYSLHNINIDYVALFLVILFYGSILYLIYKNDKFSKLLRISFNLIETLFISSFNGKII